MDWHRRPEDIPLCRTCRLMGELARKLELDGDMPVCDWAITMQTKDADGNVEVRSACGKSFLTVELLRTQDLARIAANTAGEARDTTLGLGEAIAQDLERVNRRLSVTVGSITMTPAAALPAIVEAEIVETPHRHEGVFTGELSE